MSAFDPEREPEAERHREEVDLPERIIVVREPLDGTPDEAAAMPGTPRATPEEAGPEAATPVEAPVDDVAPAPPSSPYSPARPVDLDEVDLRSERDPVDEEQAWLASLRLTDDAGPPTARPPATPFRWPEPPPEPRPAPGRDETGPGTLRPKVPEPVVVARAISSPSRSHRTVRRLRALIGLALVVVLAGVGLAGAIGAAVLLVVLALSRAFGSG